MGNGLSTGIASVDDLFTVSEGQLSIVTGLPSSGKSEFIDQVMINMAQQHHWKFAVCSFENPPHFHIAKLAEKIVGKPFFEGKSPRIEKHELDHAMKFIDEHFVFLDQKDGVVATIDSIIDRAKQAVLRLGVRGLVIDPYNYIEQDGTEEHTS
ncbi:MAG: topoisomerase, partial [Marivivens sp.]|nr:topoisomerase [Marivivens sp.]